MQLEGDAPMTQAEPKYLTITEVSRITGYCVSHLRALVDRGVVSPARTNGGVRLFTREDVGRLQARRDHTARPAKRASALGST